MAGARALVLLLPALLLPAASEDQALLARIDRLRHPWPAFTVEMVLEAPRVQQRWRVCVRENGDVRVEGLSAKEKDRVVLMLGEELWMRVPGSRRPLKVTPQQRLMGPASGGDLARLRFAEDYLVEARREEPLEGKPSLRLDLKARRPSCTWRSAQLWLDAAGTRPLRAAFLMPSGRMAKQMVFEAPVKVHGLPVIPALRIEEPGGAQATLRFERWEPGRVDASRFRLEP
jgi:hypothetical protein